MDCQTTVFTKFKARICGYVVMIGVALLALGCHNITPDASPASQQIPRPARPMDVDPAVAANLGREALEKVGYDRIMDLANQAGFVAYRGATSEAGGSGGMGVRLVSDTQGFAAVFSRYAVVAGVTSQLDSPLPGPADLVALGVLVLGVVDAGLLDGAMFGTVAGWFVGSAEASQTFMAKGGWNNVADTAVINALTAGLAARGLTDTEENICLVLKAMYDEADQADDAKLMKKIEATQKSKRCRNKKKRGG